MCICIRERELYACVSENYGEEIDRETNTDRETETEKQTESKTSQNSINAFGFINRKI